MGSILIALIPLITEFVSGDTLAEALGALTLTQWITLAAQLINAEPQLATALKSLHPAMEKFVSAIEAGVDHSIAATAIFGFFAEKKPLTIPGYAPDGEVGTVPNPDAK